MGLLDEFFVVKGNFVKEICFDLKTILISCAGSRHLKINLMDTTKKSKPSGRKRQVLTNYNINSLFVIFLLYFVSNVGLSFLLSSDYGS